MESMRISMRIKDFYRNMRCEQIPRLEKFVSKNDNRKLIMDNATRMLCTLLSQGKATDYILGEIESLFRREYAKNAYTFDWQFEHLVRRDVKLYKRFLDYYEEKGFHTEEFLQAVGLDLDKPLFGGITHLAGICHLIASRGGVPYAFIINSGMSKRSMGGRSNATNIAYDLNCLVTKKALELRYPGIIVGMVYLSSPKDTHDDLVPFDENGTLKSNVHYVSYSDLYECGNLSSDIINAMIADEVTRGVKSNCADCDYRKFCQAPSLSLCSDFSEEEDSANGKGGYVLPSFTAEQYQLIQHVDGPMRVFAGPGSGKTAALVGRVYHLVKNCGIAPEFMLVVTFAKKAAEELAERCRAFLSGDSMPTISTLHAFALSILVDNEELVGKISILGSDQKLGIIKALSSVTPPLKGFNYGNEYGAHGFFNHVCKTIENYLRDGDAEAFLQQNPEYGYDLIEFAHQYLAAIKAGGYVEFDAIIPLCNSLFESHPEVLEVYQNVYKYIMVDEFQDVSKDQVEFLCHLAARHRNITVVGDDDQSIYGFRGGSSEYLLSFDKIYPDAKEVVFSTNFRSSKSIIDASTSVIRNNQSRMEKQIVPGVSASVDVKPIVLEGTSPVQVESLISHLAKQGIPYGNIAVIASKNAPLEEYLKSFSIPCVLAKSYLQMDGFFLFVHAISLLCVNPEDETALYQLMVLFGLSKYLAPCKELSLLDNIKRHYSSGAFGEDSDTCYHLFSIISYAKGVYDKSSTLQFLEACHSMIGWTQTNSLEVLKERLELRNISSKEEFVDMCEQIAAFDTDTRVEVLEKDKVLLITSHDAKGKEFPCVILINDFGKKTNAESRNLFYVATTRARMLLYVLNGDKANRDYIEEMNLSKEVS